MKSREHRAAGEVATVGALVQVGGENARSDSRIHAHAKPTSAVTAKPHTPPVGYCAQHAGGSRETYC